ncbi:hypothetical protein HDU98_006817 [Podochytrium sp. JEL0797]|nr:hypothetical protein HDU98_006817 [Podochytrium sp. JEL0797]
MNSSQPFGGPQPSPFGLVSARLDSLDVSTLLTLFVLVLALVHHLSHSKVRLFHSTSTVLVASSAAKTPLALLLGAKCPSLSNGFFRPTPWLKGGNLQTIWAGLISKFAETRGEYDRDLIDSPDGGLVAIDWAPRNHRDLSPTTPILILLHGLAGGSSETYICDLLPTALKSGYKVAALNFRGCGGLELTTPQLYSASFTTDVRLLTAHIHKLYPDAPLVGIGFSLGANILLKSVGEDSADSLLMACVCIGNPFDLNLGMSFLHSTWIGEEFYSRVMTKNLIGIYDKHKRMFEKHPNQPHYTSPLSSPQILSSTYLSDFDEHATRRTFSFRSVTEYYRMASSAQYLPDVRIPTLLLSDTSDPIARAEAIPVADVLANPCVVLATTSGGGHIGWFEGWWRPKRWFVRPVMEFVDMLVELRLQSSRVFGLLPEAFFYRLMSRCQRT